MDSESRHNTICEICAGNHPTEAHVPRRTVVQEMPYPTHANREYLERIKSKRGEIESEALGDRFINLDLRAAGYGQIILKDESTNPTGTHKDHLALEVAKSFVEGSDHVYSLIHENGGVLLDDAENEVTEPTIRRFSLVTSGHGGMALASRFKKHDLPPPKLLLDAHTDPEIVQQLKDMNADIYLVDLSAATLQTQDILQLTNNHTDGDLTSENMRPRDGFWEWYYKTLAGEIQSQKPDQIYVPHGSGNLFEGIVNETLRYTKRPQVFGAEPESPDTKAVMLYAPSKPFQRFGRLVKLPENAQILKITEEDIALAHDVYQKHGVKAGYSSAAGLALYLKNFKEGRVSDHDKVIVVNTGRGIVQKDW